MISVIIGTFGEEKWISLAQQARLSVENQTVRPESIHCVHSDTLANARNGGAAAAAGDWLLFLDADDWLDESFIENAWVAVNTMGEGNWLIRPSVSFSDDPDHVHVIEPMPILDGNYMIVGTLVKKSTFLGAGGFRDLPIYEDWDLWIRCMRDGAIPRQAPDCLYHITVNPDSRNNQSEELQRRIGQQIRDTYAGTMSRSI